MTAEFAARVRAFFDGRAPKRAQQVLEWCVGSDEVPVFDSPSEEEEKRQLQAARQWLGARAAAGLSWWLDGPAEFGGAGLAAAEAELYAAIEQEYEIPRLDTLIPSLRIVVPGLIACAGDELKRRFLPGLLRGELIACQLFSEPGAGSDLAGIRTAARRDGTGWVVSGQKVWTTGAHYSDVGLLIARTAQTDPPHRGLTAFLVDIHERAIQVRPLRHMGGDAHFNEVFIDELRIDDARRVGEEGQGWAVAMATLMGERQALGNSRDTPPIEVAQRLELLIRHGPGLPPQEAAVLRDAATQVRVLAEVLELTNARLGYEALQRGSAGPEASIGKLLKNRLLRLATDTAGIALGPRMIAETGGWSTTAWARAAVLAPGLRIGGGTDEIQKNILAERVLGLPKEGRPGG